MAEMTDAQASLEIAMKGRKNTTGYINPDSVTADAEKYLRWLQRNG